MSNFDAERETINRAVSKSQKEDLAQFLSQPMVGYMMAQIPGDDKGTLRTLLEAAFVAGHASGQGVVLASMVERIFKGRPR
jgi:hypothetical protein